MRLMVDTNIYVSYLLAPDRGGTISSVVEAAFAAGNSLLLPEEQLDELLDVLTSRPYITSRVSRHVATRFVEELRAVAVLLPAVAEQIPSAVRDPEDNYLIAQALLGRADYLVTGDEDLLALGEVEDLRIVTPRQFAEIVSKPDNSEDDL